MNESCLGCRSCQCLFALPADPTPGTTPFMLLILFWFLTVFIF